jgi:pSer/pThr/pTyr-binding forkhead associated (FHA) protein
VGSGGVRVDESRHVPGRSAQEVSEQVRRAVDALPDHQCATVSAGTHTVVRTFRPRFRPLTTATEVCTITVVEAPLGVVVTTIGALLPQTRQAVVQALASGPPREAMQPVLSVPPTTGPAVAPAPAPAPARPAPAPAPTVAPVVLRLPDGRLVPLGGATVVVGRDPVARASDVAPTLVAMLDETRTVSKTHFACGHDERGLWVEDRGSTNGTTVSDRSGQAMELPTGRRVRVPVDVTIVFGDQRATVSRAEAGRTPHGGANR